MINVTYKIENFDEVEKTVELSYYSSDFLRTPDFYKTIKINLDQLKNNQSVDEQLSKIAQSMVLTEIEKEKTLKQSVKFFEDHLNQYIPFYFVKNGEEKKEIGDREPDVKFKIVTINKESLTVTIEPYCSLFKKPEGSYAHHEFEILDIGSSSEEALKTYIFKTMEANILQILEDEKSFSSESEDIISENLEAEEPKEEIREEQKKDLIEMEDLNDQILSFIKSNVGVEKEASEDNNSEEPFKFLN